jgi:pimeloyl-ACP methyl ester carboxylesterase
MPPRGVDKEAEAQGLRRIDLQGTEFGHSVLQNRAAGTAPALLHVYIDGDGTPWIGAGRPARDPGPRNPLALRLMGLDRAPAVYLGRPCYLGRSADPACHPWHWTHGRYGEPVVASMAAALERLRQARGDPELALIGYSGGGALAMLLAARLERVPLLVTLAGNLDPERWAERHGYSPLSTSLNPSSLGPLSARTRQIHIVGAQDQNLPPELIRAALRNQPRVELWVVPGMDHRCCWERDWPELLRRIFAKR